MQPNPTRGLVLVTVAQVARLLRDHDDTAALLLRLVNAEDAHDPNVFAETARTLFDLSPILKEITRVN